MIIISKKFLLLLPFIALIFVAVVSSVTIANQDFDGLFTMNTHIGEHFTEVWSCYQSKPLGCNKLYWEDNSDGELILVYYDDSNLMSYESNAWQYAINILNTTYLYKFYEEDGNLIVLTNDITMRNLPPYLVGVSNDDGSKAVFVGGYNLGELKTYAKSIEFR